MAKLASSVLWVLLVLVGSTRPALAQLVPGGGGEAVCQVVTGGIVTEQTGGLFPGGSGACNIGAIAEASISITPTAELSANVDSVLVEEGNHNGVQASVALQYSFTLTGGSPGDSVPIVVHSLMFTDASTSDDPNNANVASASINLFPLSGVGGSIIGSGPSETSCTISPDPGGCFGEFDDDLSLTMTSGSAELVFMRINVAGSSNSSGTATALIDPYIRVDPHFANAADYTITVNGGVGNTPPVPEPGVVVLLLAGWAW